MNFQSITQHLEHYGCTLDHLEGKSYMATNCVNAHICLIEKLSKYSKITLCHYWYELGIPAPAALKSEFTAYQELREQVFNKAEE
jgi:hypothetical protein